MARSDESYLDSLLHSLSEPDTELQKQEQAMDNDSISHEERKFTSNLEGARVAEPFANSGEDELDIDNVSFDDIDIDRLFTNIEQKKSSENPKEDFEEEMLDELLKNSDEENGLKLRASDRESIENMLSSQEDAGRDWEEEPQAELLEGLQDVADMPDSLSENGGYQDQDKKRPFFADIADPLLTEEQKSLFPKHALPPDDDKLSTEDMQALKEALFSRNPSFSDPGQESWDPSDKDQLLDDSTLSANQEEAAFTQTDGNEEKFVSEEMQEDEESMEDLLPDEFMNREVPADREQNDFQAEDLMEDMPADALANERPIELADSELPEREAPAAWPDSVSEESGNLSDLESGEFEESGNPTGFADDELQESESLADLPLHEKQEEEAPADDEFPDLMTDPINEEREASGFIREGMPELNSVGKVSEWNDEEEMPDMDLLNGLLEDLPESEQEEADQEKNVEAEKAVSMEESVLFSDEPDLERGFNDSGQPDRSEGLVPEENSGNNFISEENADLFQMVSEDQMLPEDQNIDREEAIEVAKDNTSNNQTDDDLLSLDSMLDELGAELEGTESSPSGNPNQAASETEEEDILSLLPDAVEEEEFAEQTETEQNPKKKGLMEKLFANVEEDPEVVAAKTAKAREKAKAKGLELDENGKPIPKPKKSKEELKAEKEAKKKEQAEVKKQKKAEADQKKAAKAAVKAEKKKEKDEQKKKKAMEEVVEVDEGRINRIGATIVFSFFGILTVLVILGTNGFSYQSSVRKAETYFTGKMYEEAYKEIRGLSIKGKDQELYDRIITVMYVEKQLNSYQNYYNMDMFPEALDSLLKGIQRYDTYAKTAKELGVKNDLDTIRSQLLKELFTTYQLTEEDAYHIINSGSQEDYSKKVIEAASAQ